MEITYKVGFKDIIQPTWKQVFHTASELANHYEWSNGDYVSNWYLDYDSELDNPILYVEGNAAGTNTYFTPKYYTAGPDLRLYGNDVSYSLSISAKGQNFMTISTPSSFEYKITKFKFKWSRSSTSVKLWYFPYTASGKVGSAIEVPSNTEITVPDIEYLKGIIVFTGDTTDGSPKSGNIRITELTIVYDEV